MVSSYPCVGPSPKTNISLFLLLICVDELMSAPNVITDLPGLSSVNKKPEHKSNPIP